MRDLPYGQQTIDQSDIDEVVAVLRGDWLTQGPTIARFEEAFAEHLGARHAVAFSSGTAALHGATHAAGLGPPDRVATSPLTFIASANSVRYVGATPVLVDIDESWNLNPAELPPDLQGIVAVHYAGLPMDLKQLPYRPPVVIEDAAHALGARSPDGFVGGDGRSDLACFSFHPVKSMTTGEGGMVTTDDDRLAARLRVFRTHGIEKSGEDTWEYNVREVGFNYRMTDIQAALGISQLRRLDEFVERRNLLAERYRHLLAGTSFRLPPEPAAGFVHSYHLFPVLTANRKTVYDELRKERIFSQVHYIPVHHHQAYADVERSGSNLPVCDRVYSEILSLPLFPGMTLADQDRVVAALRRICGQ